MTTDRTASAGGLPDLAAPLRTRVFRTLTAGWALTNFADSVLTLILGVWVAELTGNVALAGATFAALGVPALASPLLGQLADRVSRRRLLVWTYAAGAAALVPLFWVDDAGDVWLVYVVTVLYASVAYVTGACQSGLLKDLLPTESLGHANGRLAAIDQVFRIAMPFVGAAVYAWSGPLPLVGATIAAFLASAVIFARVRIVESPPEPRDGATSFVREASEGFRHLFHTRPLRSMTITMLLAMAATGLVNAVAFAILDGFGIPPVLLGPLTAFQGVTGLAAGILAPRLMGRWGRPRVYAVGLLLAAAGLAPLLSTWIPLAVLGMGLLGFGITATVIAYVTERQVLTPARLQGRTAAASHLVMNLPGVFVTMAGALLLAVVDYRVLVVVNVVACLTCGLVALFVREQGPPSSSSTTSTADGERGSGTGEVATIA